MGRRLRNISINEDKLRTVNRKVLRSESKPEKMQLKSNTIATNSNHGSGKKQTLRKLRTRSQSQTILTHKQSQPHAELKRTRSMMLDMSAPASFAQLISSPRKRRRCVRLSCDSSESGDSGLGDSAGSTVREDGFSSPESPLTPLEDMKPLSLIINNPFTTNTEQTNQQKPSRTDGLLTLTFPPSTEHPSTSRKASSKQTNDLESEDVQLCKIHSTKQSLSQSKEKRKSHRTNRQSTTKRNDTRGKVRVGSPLHRSRSVKRFNNRHRLSKSEARRNRLEAQRKRASYMARRLNPHLQSPERDQPKKLARRSLTSVIHERRSHLVNVHAASPRKRRVRPSNDVQSPVELINTTQTIQTIRTAQTAQCEEDSGVGSDDQSSDTSACNWKHCRCIVSSKELVDHLKKVHVANQTLHNKVYRCYWDGCKVFGQKAKSLLWLEGHVMKHLGPKPHYCIYPECSARFSTNEMLMKHVESHIKTEISKTSPSKQSVINKRYIKAKRNVRMRILRQSEKCLVPRSDYFTHDIIEYIKWEEKTLREKWGNILSTDKQHLNFTAQIAGLCTTEEGAQKVLLRWSPEEFNVPDSWHHVSDPIAQTLTKQVNIGSLPQHILYSQ